MKRQLATGAVEGHEADLVEDQHVRSLEVALVPAELACVTGLQKRPHQVGGAPEEHVPALPGRLDAEGDRQVRLPRADRPCEDHVAVLGDLRCLGARSATVAASTPSAAAKSKASKVLSSGKRACRIRSRTAESWREVSSTERPSCR